jgi:hypothetical protein
VLASAFVTARATRLAALLGATIACGPRPGGSTRIAGLNADGSLHTTPLPPGWWIVTSTTREGVATLGAAWRFEPHEYQLVRPDRVERQRTRLEARSQDTWAGEEPGPYLLHRQEGTLSLVTSAPPAPVTLTLRPALPEETVRAEAALAEHGTLEAACARATRCFREASTALSPSHAAPREMPEDSSLHRCEEIAKSYGAMFATLGRPIPVDCAGPPDGAPPQQR